MAEGNGVSRREFDRLESRVDLVYDKGSPQVRALEVRMEIELRGVREDIQEQNRRLVSIARLGWSILIALIVGLVSLLTAVSQGLFG